MASMTGQIFAFAWDAAQKNNKGTLGSCLAAFASHEKAIVVAALPSSPCIRGVEGLKEVNQHTEKHFRISKKDLTHFCPYTMSMPVAELRALVPLIRHVEEATSPIPDSVPIYMETMWQVTKIVPYTKNACWPSRYVSHRKFAERETPADLDGTLLGDLTTATVVQGATADLMRSMLVQGATTQAREPLFIRRHWHDKATFFMLGSVDAFDEIGEASLLDYGAGRELYAKIFRLFLRHSPTAVRCFGVLAKRIFQGENVIIVETDAARATSETTGQPVKVMGDALLHLCRTYDGTSKTLMGHSMVLAWDLQHAVNAQMWEIPAHQLDFPPLPIKGRLSDVGFCWAPGRGAKTVGDAKRAAKEAVKKPVKKTKVENRGAEVEESSAKRLKSQSMAASQM